MRLKDVPQFPAYYVFHDAYMNGADVYPANSLEEATRRANLNQTNLEHEGAEDSGHWRAYEKLPRVKVLAFYAQKAEAL